jgi:hypothetical protein
MPRKTKTKRLQEVVDEYHRRNPGPFTMDAVALWAIHERLYPTPGRLTREIRDAAGWDARFARIQNEDIGT